MEALRVLGCQRGNRLVPGDVDHRRRRVDPGQPVILPRQHARDLPGTACEVDDRSGVQLGGKLQIEVRLRVGGVRVDRVVDRDEPRVGELGDFTDAPSLAASTLSHCEPCRSSLQVQRRHSSRSRAEPR
jgi:hypothetical protein